MPSMYAIVGWMSDKVCRKPLKQILNIS